MRRGTLYSPLLDPIWRAGQARRSEQSTLPLESRHIFVQDNNKVIRKWGEERHEEKLYNHVDLVEMLGIADVDKGQLLIIARCSDTSFPIALAAVHLYGEVLSVGSSWRDECAPVGHRTVKRSESVSVVCDDWALSKFALRLAPLKKMLDPNNIVFEKRSSFQDFRPSIRTVATVQDHIQTCFG